MNQLRICCGGLSCTASLFFAILLSVQTASLEAIEITVTSKAGAGSNGGMTGSTSEETSAHEVTLWWCSFAPIEANRGDLSAEIKSPSGSYNCVFRRSDQRIALCECDPVSERAGPSLFLDYIWQDKGRYGQSLFLRSIADDYVSEEAATKFVNEVRKELGKAKAFDDLVWVFLIDGAWQEERGDRFSLGKIVFDGRGDIVISEGHWVSKPAAPASGYRIAKEETYSASLNGRFEKGRKVHVITSDWPGAEMAAREIARNRSERCVVVYFWRSEDRIGKEAAIYGVELLDGRVRETMVDLR